MRHSLQKNHVMYIHIKISVISQICHIEEMLGRKKANNVKTSPVSFQFFPQQHANIDRDWALDARSPLEMLT